MSDDDGTEITLKVDRVEGTEIVSVEAYGNANPDYVIGVLLQAVMAVLGKEDHLDNETQGAVTDILKGIGGYNGR